MDIVQATTKSHWQEASQMLMETLGYLAKKGTPLWTEDQINPEGLQKTYRLEELYFLLRENKKFGLVFLQKQDPLFWPEIATGDTLFFHKLAITPKLIGQGLGKQAIALISREALHRDLKWLRVDCDDRPALHHFYQKCGFEHVDTKPVGAFVVARYQMEI